MSKDADKTPGETLNHAQAPRADKGKDTVAKPPGPDASRAGVQIGKSELLPGGKAK